MKADKEIRAFMTEHRQALDRELEGSADAFMTEFCGKIDAQGEKEQIIEKLRLHYHSEKKASIRRCILMSVVIVIVGVVIIAAFSPAYNALTDVCTKFFTTIFADLAPSIRQILLDSPLSKTLPYFLLTILILQLTYILILIPDGGRCGRRRWSWRPAA